MGLSFFFKFDIYFFLRETPYDEKLIQRYRKALDTAVKIATVHNVLPISGRTIIFCNLRRDADVPCQAAKKGLGKPRTVSITIFFYYLRNVVIWGNMMYFIYMLTLSWYYYFFVFASLNVLLLSSFLLPWLTPCS